MVHNGLEYGPRRSEINITEKHPADRDVVPSFFSPNRDVSSYPYLRSSPSLSIPCLLLVVRLAPKVIVKKQFISQPRVFSGKKETSLYIMDSALMANFLGSAAAGIIARSVTHPLDTAKARLQAVSAHNYTGPLDVLLRTARTEGIKGLYRGFGAVIIGGTPGTVIYLCSYEIAKKQLGEALHGSQEEKNVPRSAVSDFLVYFSSGIIAEAVACIVYVPVDVVKERLQVQHNAARPGQKSMANNNNYQGSWHALRAISSSEGITTLYKGYAATLISFGSYSGFFFLFYERLLKETRQYLATTDSSFDAEQREVPFQWTLICSCTAGAAASWLTSPLDMAKLRLQVQRGQVAAGASRVGTVYRGVVDCLVHSYRQQGLAGLFRGKSYFLGFIL